MFSNINEVWGKKGLDGSQPKGDPVRQISEKISKGLFQKDPYHEIYNMPKSQKEAQEIKLSAPEPTDQSYDLASDSKYSLLSDTDLAPFGDEVVNKPVSSPKPVLKNPLNKKKDKSSKSFDMLTSEDISMSLTDFRSVDSDEFSSDASVSVLERKKCSKVAHHLKKCPRCSRKLKKIINNKLNSKYKDLLMSKQLNQPLNIQSVPTVQSSFSDSFKETLLIIVGAIIVLFILFLIARSFSK